MDMLANNSLRYFVTNPLQNFNIFQFFFFAVVPRQFFRVAVSNIHVMSLVRSEIYDNLTITLVV